MSCEIIKRIKTAGRQPATKTLLWCEGQYHKLCKINRYEKIGNVHDEL